MMRIRDSILRKLKRNRSENNLKLYRKFRNRMTVEIKRSILHNFHDNFSSNSQNMKTLCQGIKSVISNNSTTTAIRGVKDTNGEVAINSTEIANTLNKSFVNVAENISKIYQEHQSHLLTISMVGILIPRSFFQSLT